MPTAIDRDRDGFRLRIGARPGFAAEAAALETALNYMLLRPAIGAIVKAYLEEVADAYVQHMLYGGRPRSVNFEAFANELDAALRSEGFPCADSD